jgi:ribosomal protein S14
MLMTSSANDSRVTGDRKKSGLIRKYGLNMSRQAFREKAEDIGFKKVRFCSVLHIHLAPLCENLMVVESSVLARADWE